MFRKSNEPRAGRYADSMYRALMARQRRRSMLAAFVGTLALAALAGVYWIAFPQLARDVTFLLTGFAIASAVWLWDYEPRWAEKWRLGKEGEQATERILKGLERDDWHAVHDIEARRGNFDHIVVGPGGVVLVESKRWRGKLRLEGETLVAQYSPDPLEEYRVRGLVRRTRGAAAELRERLRERGVKWVTAVVAVHGDLDPPINELPGVTVVRGDHLEEWIRGLPQRLPPAAVEPLARELATLARENGVDNRHADDRVPQRVGADA